MPGTKIMLIYTEVLWRLVVAVLIGSIIGIDRNLHGKPTGIKTLGMVALGATALTMVGMDLALTHPSSPSPIGSTIQGIITGIGFLGAGVIIHVDTSEKVHGLTTAASIWVTAALGIACGLGSWEIVGTASCLMLLLFVVGRPLEKALHRRWLQKPEAEKRTISSHEE